jgi:Polysaccharide deacetylase
VDRRFPRNTAGWLFASTLRLTGALRRSHRAAMRTDCTLGLLFHSPLGDHFARIIRWFQERGYRFLSVGELESYFSTTTPLPTGSVWISFDDAYRRNLTEVIPIIRDWNLPVTIFVPTQEVRRGTFWFSHVLKNSAALPEPFRSDIQQLWRVPESTRRSIVEHLFEILPPAQRDAMSVAEIANLAKMPQVTIALSCRTVLTKNFARR